MGPTHSPTALPSIAVSAESCAPGSWLVQESSVLSCAIRLGGLGDRDTEIVEAATGGLNRKGLRSEEG